MKNEKKLKVKRIITVLIIMLMVICIICLIIKGDVFAKKARKDYGYEIMGIYKDPSVEIKEKILSVEGSEIISKFEGKLPVSKVTSTIKNIFIEKIPEEMAYCRNFNQEELTKHYNSNINRIEYELRIKTEEDFINMIKMFNTIKADLKNDYEKCKFLDEDELVRLVFSYTNEEKITCIIRGKNVDTFSLEF